MKRKFESTKDSLRGDLCEICGDFAILPCVSCTPYTTRAALEKTDVTPKRSRSHETLEWTVGDWISTYADHTLHHAIASKAVRRVGNSCRGSTLADIWIPIARALNEVFHHTFKIQCAQVMWEPDFGGGYEPLFPEQISECKNFPDASIYRVKIPIIASVKLLKRMCDYERKMKARMIVQWESQV